MSRKKRFAGQQFAPTNYVKRQQTELEGYYSEKAELRKEIALLQERKKNIKTEIDKEFENSRLEIKEQQKNNIAYKEKLGRKDKDLTEREKSLEKRQEAFSEEIREAREKSTFLEASLSRKITDLAEEQTTLEELIATYRKKLSNLIEKQKSLSAERVEFEDEKNLIEKRISFNQELKESIDRKKANLGETLDKIDKEREALLRNIQELEDLRTNNKKECALLEEKKATFSKEQEGFEKKKKDADIDAKNTTDLKNQLVEQEAHQKDVARAQALERRELDGKIKLIKKLREEGNDR